MTKIGAAVNRAAYRERIAEVLGADAGGVKVPYPVGLRAATVRDARMIGAGLLRLTFAGPELDGFVTHAPTEHVRLIFPDADGTLRLPEQVDHSLKWPRPLPISREYTVRRYDPVAQELDIDFAVHPGGYAAEWAVAATPGTSVHIAGPPGGLIVPFTYDRYLLAGDITALPAIARWLEELPPDAAGWAFIEVVDATEEIDLVAPAGVEVRWLHRGAAAPGTSDLLERAVRAVPIPEGERVYAFIAAEAGVVRPLRRWVREVLRAEPGDADVTAYWKRGQADFDEDEDD
ncbi:NADPH-dependent ferric siderophore reductase [Nocardia tenerifensis]|uniref:NADPH-dependent ferric siderophore reductase n=1 Tax=Nocardia tenerifensis TaxID=228006 RepID=A0A318KX43_9NOCA|nr:siderophore-interacting protein [Nocardia tenerifensis]PXX69331.1 NADPH-dependent ferric siderophore reductase [Nocardia tenerifensis]